MSGMKALVTGITGQDGSYLAEFLLSRGYEVHGIMRRASTFNTARIDHIYQDPHKPEAKLFLYYGDLSDSTRISDIVQTVRPDEIYHLGAQSHVKVSFEIPEYTGNISALGTTRMLESLRGNADDAKFFQASSSEMFGSSPPPQGMGTPFRPRSPYAAAKLYAFWMTVNYREAYKLFASNGILFNHESPRRGETFVTRKVTMALANILAGRQDSLFLGNLQSRRDWGFAPEYVEIMWRILQKDMPGDFVVGTGQSHTVQEFVEEAFSYAGLDWNRYVHIDPKYYRPTEPEELLAEPSQAIRELDWSPRIGFRELVRIMVDADMRRAGLRPIGEGDNALSTKFGIPWWKVD